MAIRLAAHAWLDKQRDAGMEGWSHADLAQFTYGAERIPLMDAQRGIRKPASMQAALSIRTVYRPVGADRPYEDGVGPDGLLRYKWRGADPDHPENRALRAAWQLQVPLIWFYGFATGLYAAVYPVYLMAEERGLQQFVVAIGEDQRAIDVGHAVSPVVRAYVERMTRQRLHQPAFRAGVMRAYGTRCAVCAFRHATLLDAAHIIGDAAGGDPVTPNGLALCRIHHGAYDANIIGIRPDLTIHVRKDVLEEVDGPMLRYGIQEHHNKALMVVPAARPEQPDPERLAARYTAFVASA